MSISDEAAEERDSLSAEKELVNIYEVLVLLPSIYVFFIIVIDLLLTTCTLEKKGREERTGQPIS